MRLRWAIVAVLVVLSAGLALVARMGAHKTDPAELVKRCAESHPAWVSYQEDIKGQVGAQPVALWRGRLAEVRQKADSITVTFQLEQPWAEYEAAVPILLRDPMGHDYQQDSVSREGSLRKYVFHLDAGSGASTLPWVEIHYPHTERRIALGTAGQWKDQPSTP